MLWSNCFYLCQGISVLLLKDAGDNIFLMSASAGYTMLMGEIGYFPGDANCIGDFGWGDDLMESWPVIMPDLRGDLSILTEPDC